MDLGESNLQIMLMYQLARFNSNETKVGGLSLGPGSVAVDRRALLPQLHFKNGKGLGDQ